MSSSPSPRIAEFNASLRVEWWFLGASAVGALGGALAYPEFRSLVIFWAIVAAGLLSYTWRVSQYLRFGIATGLSSGYCERTTNPRQYWLHVGWLLVILVAVLAIGAWILVKLYAR